MIAPNITYIVRNRYFSPPEYSCYTICHFHLTAEHASNSEIKVKTLMKITLRTLNLELQTVNGGLSSSRCASTCVFASASRIKYSIILCYYHLYMYLYVYI